jgi:CheY-like chemotaxis protein
MVADNSPQTLKVKQILEDNGCQVYWIETYFDYLARASQTYFDLIVLDIEKPDEDSLEMYKKLKDCPKLADIPIVILTTHNYPGETINGSKTSPTYVLTKDPGAGLKLLQIIEQVHYMTYRYL